MRGLRLSIFLLATLLCVAFQLTLPTSVRAEGDPAAGVADSPHPEEGDSEQHNADSKSHGGAGGVPLDFKRDLAIWSLVVFLVFIFVLKKFAWGPLSAGLDKREGRIRQDIADAESARIKAEQMLAAHQQKLETVQDEVKEILLAARRDAEQARQNVAEAAKLEAEATKQRAIVDIERARDQALNELFDVMAGQVATATEYVLGHGLKPDNQDQLIQQALAEIGGEAK